MKLGRFSVGVFLALALALLMPRTTHRESPDGPLIADIRNIHVIADIRNIHVAELEFFSRYGRYATLSEMGPSGVGLLGSELAEGRTRGQNFVLRVSGSGYTIQTAPTDGSRGRFRSYYSDETLVVRESSGPGLATGLSRELGSGR
jgi:hypothetical protein